MQQRPRHRRHTAVAQGTYQGVCLVHARSQLALYNQQQSTTLNVEHSSPVTHATKATAHTARPWPRTTVICNEHAACQYALIFLCSWCISKFCKDVDMRSFFCVKIAALSQKLSLLLYHPSNVPIAVQHNSHKALHLIRNSKLTLSQCVNHVGQKGTLSTPLSVNEWHTIC